jgi:hypothetical protein
LPDAPGQGIIRESTEGKQGARAVPYRLIYASSAKRHLVPEDLGAILAVARRNNARQGISGMLLYKDGSFIPLLEGDKPSVLGLFEIIKADPRHGAITVLDEREADVQTLADWSMGYREAEPGSEAAGLFKLTERAIDEQLADTPRAILRFMRNFYAINRG